MCSPLSPWTRRSSRGRCGIKITREWVQQTNGVLAPLDVKELRYKETTQRLTLGLRIGLYHNLELHVGAPIILSNHPCF